MSNRTLFALTAIAILTVVILFGLRLQQAVPQFQERYLSLNDVRGMAVKYQQKLYTLNLQQQVDAVRYLNSAKPIKQTAFTPQQRDAVAIDQIIIYRFDPAADIFITPVAYVDDSLIFTAPRWHHEGYLMEQTHGKLKTLLSKTHAKAAKHQ